MESNFLWKILYAFLKDDLDALPEKYSRPLQCKKKEDIKVRNRNLDLKCYFNFYVDAMNTERYKTE